MRLSEGGNCKIFAPYGAFLVKPKNISFLLRARAKIFLRFQIRKTTKRGPLVISLVPVGILQPMGGTLVIFALVPRPDFCQGTPPDDYISVVLVLWILRVSLRFRRHWTALCETEL